MEKTGNIKSYSVTFEKKKLKNYKSYSVTFIKTLILGRPENESVQFISFVSPPAAFRTISGNPRQFNCRDESVLLVFSGACNKENISQESNECLHFCRFCAILCT